MPTLKHIVIFIYIAELIAFAMLYMGHRRPGQRLRENPVALLCAFMVFRVAVKMFYFYTEFYVFPWHLNILFNSLMDTTYVISLWLSLRVACTRAAIDFPRPRLYLAAAILYVVGFATISFFWVDRASNHLILIQSGLPQVLYNANETLFLAVAATTAFSVAHRARTSDARNLAIAIAVIVSLYALYVFFWDVSFTIPGVEVLRNIKPFDGVLFFAAALIATLAALCPPPQPAQQPAEQPAPAPAAPEPDLAAFAAEHNLTAREAEVLELLFQGRSSSQIAEELVISTNTVKRHTYNLYRKAGVSNRYELLYKVNHPGQPIPAESSENTGE